MDRTPHYVLLTADIDSDFMVLGMSTSKRAVADLAMEILGNFTCPTEVRAKVRAELVRWMESGGKASGQVHLSSDEADCHMRIETVFLI